MRTSNKIAPAQMEIPGTEDELTNALNDLVEMIDEIEKAKEALPYARTRVASMMKAVGKDSIRHAGRTFVLTETKIVEPTIRIIKKDV